MYKSKHIFFFLLILFSTATLAELSDPTRPTMGDAGDFSEGKLQLNALMHSGKETVVIISGNVLRLHDVIAGYEVTQIKGDVVTLKSKKNGEFLQLTMKMPEVKTPA
jgi:hypothetical protein